METIIITADKLNSFKDIYHDTTNAQDQELVNLYYEACQVMALELGLVFDMQYGEFHNTREYIVYGWIAYHKNGTVGYKMARMIDNYAMDVVRSELETMQLLKYPSKWAEAID